MSKLPHLCRIGPLTYFFLEEAVEDKDKHSLEGVECSKEVGHHHGGLIDEEQSKGPSQAQQTQQSKGSQDPGPRLKQTHNETNPL